MFMGLPFWFGELSFSYGSIILEENETVKNGN
jgi:hypothetical protein